MQEGDVAAPCEVRALVETVVPMQVGHGKDRGEGARLPLREARRVARTPSAFAAAARHAA